jgi:hypothetical protein
VNLLPPPISASDPALLGQILGVPEDDNTVTGALRLRLIRQGVSWQRLVQLANEQGVLFPLIGALMRAKLLPPVPQKQSAERATAHPTVQLEAVYQEHLARRERQKDQLAAILKSLNRNDVQPLLLKGSRYLLAPAGDWCLSRDMRDIDLLVHPEKSAQAMGALIADGYIADQRPIPLDQHLPELWRGGCPSAVELHIESLSFSARSYLPTDHLWRQAVRTTTAEGEFFTLPLQGQLLYAVLDRQMSDRHYAQRVLDLKSLWEFAMLARDVSEQDWKQLADDGATRGYADVLASTFLQAMQLFGAALPSAVTVSPAARAHAFATLENATAPGWRRRLRSLTDQLTFAFARDTLAARYCVTPGDVGVVTRARHLLFLLRHYRGRIAMRLFGQRGRT